MKKVVMLGTAATLVPAAVFAAHAAPEIWPTERFFPRVVRMNTNKAIALTFDDGPDRKLESFLNLLEEAEAQATFFVVGEQVKRDQGKLREIVSCGHEVAVHCYRHRSYLRLAHWQVVQDMRRVKGVIEEAVGRPPQLFRPPYGQFSLSCWLEAERQGWRPILWSRDSRDWDGTNTPRSIADRVGWPAGGDIILMHDSDRYASPYSWRNTLGALPIILERAYSAGLAVCSVGDLLGAELLCEDSLRESCAEASPVPRTPWDDSLPEKPFGSHG